MVFFFVNVVKSLDIGTFAVMGNIQSLSLKVVSKKGCIGVEEWLQHSSLLARSEFLIIATIS